MFLIHFPNMTLPKTYSAKEFEQDLYKDWESKGLFRPEVHPNGEPFSIVLPPPNATGVLHLGHATMLAVEDIMVRYHRMKGDATLWVPGTDHAAIATQSVVEKLIMKEEGKSRHDLGRDAFLERVKQFVEQSKDTIRSQVRAMGASVDWSRERYTLDESMNQVVNRVFVKMYEDGLMYRGHRIVNWDPKGQTTVADDELEYVTEKTPFYTFKYGPFEIGTARPETKFGDKYVVMHPDDKRYAQYKHGDTFTAEWINGPVTATVIKDASIDMEFGTGVMTITPWHDAIDFDIAERHKLDKQQIIGFDGKLLDVAGEFAGMKIDAARPKIVEKLAAKGLLVKTDEDYSHNVAVSYRGGGKIEPQIKEQWFIDVNKPAVKWGKQTMSLKEVMQAVVRNEEIKIIPERFEKTYFAWVDNLRDWCVSRQIWWGHRIPVWYAKDGSGLHVSIKPPEDAANWEQDPDTLDTWFSSALWSWSTLLNQTMAENEDVTLADLLAASPDYQKFHPNSVMETGYDIIFFWVARMILMTTYVTGEIPFKTVYLHGLVRDMQGRKMSKSLGNGIDPVEMVAKYGADAVRLALIIGTTPGNDVKLNEQKIENYRNFVNKLWNIARFILTTVEKPGVVDVAPEPKTLSDRWILSRFQRLIEDTTKQIDNYQFSAAGEALYGFTWNELADWYVEDAKVEKGKDDILLYLLTNLLKLWQPFTPFVAEVLYKQLLPEQALMIAEWPKINKKLVDEKSETLYGLYQGVVIAIRNFRAQFKVSYTTPFAATVITNDAEAVESLKAAIVSKTKLSGLEVSKADRAAQSEATCYFDGGKVYIPMAGLVDTEKELDRLNKELEATKKYIGVQEKKLANKEFVKNAPAALVEGERNKQSEAEAKLKSIQEQITMLSS